MTTCSRVELQPFNAHTPVLIQYLIENKERFLNGMGSKSNLKNAWLRYVKDLHKQIETEQT